MEDKFSWDLSKFYKSVEDWEKDLENLKTLAKGFEKFKGKFNNPEMLYEYFLLDNKVSRLLERLSMFVEAKIYANGEDRFFKELQTKLMYVYNDISRATTFVTVEMSKLSNKYLNELINNKKFEDYNLILKNVLKNKKRKLSKKEEELLSKLNFSGFAYEIFHAYDDIDIKFNKIKNEEGKLVELTNSNYGIFIESPVRSVRKAAFESLFNTYKNMLATLSTNYIYSLREDWFYSEIRKYESVLAEALDDDDVKKKLYDNLIKSTHKNTKYLQKGFKLLKKALGLKTFEYYDVYTNIKTENNKKIEFEKACELVKSATKVLGEEYTELVERAIKERWVDVYPRKAKYSGAFEMGMYDETPIVLINYEKDLESVFTLAHELGHAMHEYYCNKFNVYEKSGHSIFNAEVASVTNEILLIKYLYENAKTKNEKLSYLIQYFRMIKGTWFRQVMFSEFEEFAHSLVEKKLPISKEILNEKYAELNKTYHGNAIKENNLIQYEWARVPHFYRPYYVYKYAIGMISAIYFANRILTGNKNEIDNYYGYLKSGSSDYPAEILKKHGADFYKSDVYKIAEEELIWVVSEMEKIIK